MQALGPWPWLLLSLPHTLRPHRLAYAYRSRFVRHPWYVADMCVLLGSAVVELETGTAYALRVWRVVRVLHALAAAVEMEWEEAQLTAQLRQQLQFVCEDRAHLVQVVCPLIAAACVLRPPRARSQLVLWAVVSASGCCWPIPPYSHYAWISDLPVWQELDKERQLSGELQRRLQHFETPPAAARPPAARSQAPSR